MEKEKMIHYKDIGDVYYRKNPRARNISIRINNGGRVRVTVPRGCSFQRAEVFLQQKSHWIQRKTAHLERLKVENLAWNPGDVLFLGKTKIVFSEGGGKEISWKSSDGDYLFNLPADYDPGCNGDGEAVFEQVASIGLTEAREQLPGILENLARQHGFSFSRLTVRRMKSRWGSCSPVNNISLNSGLIFLPDELVHYVCLHELVHTVHKNHGRSFWDMLTTLMPEAPMLRRDLRRRTIIA